jgi:hypothetical protein
VELEKELQEAKELIGTYQIALELLAEFRGKKQGLHYGSDGLEKMRSVARQALRA